MRESTCTMSEATSRMSMTAWTPPSCTKKQNATRQKYPVLEHAAARSSPIDRAREVSPAAAASRREAGPSPCSSLCNASGAPTLQQRVRNERRRRASASIAATAAAFPSLSPLSAIATSRSATPRSSRTLSTACTHASAASASATCEAGWSFTESIAASASGTCGGRRSDGRCPPRVARHRAPAARASRDASGETRRVQSAGAAIVTRF
mmetsp:Transcript_17679/g.42627  ORF Transcript_17679/g.42627 Transcript_17679/m.42627 type:complete len:209 (-) Transcript_17679:335-961(-)